MSPNLNRTSAVRIVRVPSFRNLSVDARRSLPFWRVSSSDGIFIGCLWMKSFDKARYANWNDQLWEQWNAAWNGEC